jgi:5-methyltetrahydrofolate--homocysteine methyltransferase
MSEPSHPGRFLAALARGPLLLDAAMGTRLIARGLDLAGDDPCHWNLEHPEDVLDIHRRDILAGSDAILTNTFGANRLTLRRLGRSGEVAAINQRAVELARRAAGPGRYVLGSVGPQAAADADATGEQVLALAEAGVDALFLETHQAHEARVRLHHLRGIVTLPILASIWVEGDITGWGPEEGVSAVGTNCLDLEATLRFIERLGRGAAVPLIAKPSAGRPDGPPASPESFAAAVPRLLALGVRLFGGCCGTTEAHVAALRAALDRRRELPSTED